MMSPKNVLSEDDGAEILAPGEGPFSDSAGAVAQIARAEIASLIETAKRWPRSVAQSQERMIDLATFDKATAEECSYTLPRQGKSITGPSIRFAEIIAQTWGNARILARTTQIDKIEKTVEAEGVFLDCETNMATLVRLKRRIDDSHGRLFRSDMIMITCNAAQSIARRNAILAGVPKPVWNRAWQAARKVVGGEANTLANRRAEAIAEMASFGLTAEHIFAVLGVHGVEDIDREKYVDLRALVAQLKNEETTVEEILATADVEVRGIRKRTPGPTDALVEDAPDSLNMQGR